MIVFVLPIFAGVREVDGMAADVLMLDVVCVDVALGGALSIESTWAASVFSKARMIASYIKLNACDEVVYSANATCESNACKH